jgi:hypothetical protein
MKDIYQLTTGDNIQEMQVYDMRQYDVELQKMQYQTALNYTNNMVWIYEHSIRVEVRLKDRTELYIFEKQIL